ncbi:hypothetical protein BH11BAC7_BH11BAC7_06890 [soil metagenome]
MEDKIHAKKTGALQALKAISAGFLVAYILMAFMEHDALWLFGYEYALILVFGILITFASGFLFGGMAGVAILINKRNALLTGIVYGFLTVWTSTFLTSLFGLFMEGIGTEDVFINYIWKPLWLVTMFGSLPILFVGLWFGSSVKASGNGKV